MNQIKFIFFIFPFFISISTMAQGNYADGVDDKNLHFGFNFQYINTEYKIQRAANWRSPFIEEGIAVTDSLQSIRSIINPGFGMGFVSDVFITPNLNVRFTPSLVFSDRVVDYQFANGASFEQLGVTAPDGFTRRTVSSTMIEFPIGIKLKSDRRNNFRAYLLAGAKYGIDIGQKKVAEDKGELAVNKFLKNNKGILSYDLGIGFDFYLEFFKLTPEIKLSNSFKSVLKKEDQPYANPIEKMYLRNFVFSLFFE